MANTKKLIQAAAGVGGAETIDGIEFIINGSVVRRSSALSGSGSGKTFTFSGWIFSPTADNHAMFSIANTLGQTRFFIHVDDNKNLYCYGTTNTGSNVFVFQSTFNRTTNSAGIPDGTWVHVMMSMDMTSAGKRHVYINGQVPSHLNFSTYSNNFIDFGESRIGVGGAYTDADSNIRLAHIFFDQNYRDLSQASNRELFLDSDGNPASGQASLSPLVYLPLNDVESPETNEGTGGAFELHSAGSGNVYTPQRGANQPKAMSCKFDGSADYLSKSFSAISTKQLTFSGVFSRNSATNTYAWSTYAGGSSINYFNIYNGLIHLENSSGAGLVNTSIGGYSKGKVFAPAVKFRHVHVSFSIDLTDSSKKHCIVDGVDITDDISWGTLTNDFIYLDSLLNINGYGDGTSLQEMTAGEFYLNDAYIDLSTSNPFWNSDTNRPKPVRQVISETGTTPRFALPIEHTKPTLNLGSVGDVSLAGALSDDRSASEYRARTAYFNGVNDFLYRTDTSSAGAISGDSSAATLFCSFRADGSQAQKTIFHIETETGGSTRFQLRYNSSSFLTGGPRLEVRAYNSSGTLIRELVTSQGEVSANNWYTLFMSYNASTTNFFLGKPNGQVYDITLATDYNAGGTVKLSGHHASIGIRYRGPGETHSEHFQDGHIGPLFFDNNYIDFSQESNRLIFADTNGQPKDLAAAISNGDITNNPVCLMLFDDDGGDITVNSGSRGDFTNNSAVTFGRDVTFKSNVGPS